MRVIGFIIFITTIFFFLLYVYLIFATDFSLLVIKLTLVGFIAMLSILICLIGLNLALVKKNE